MTQKQIELLQSVIGYQATEDAKDVIQTVIGHSVTIAVEEFAKKVEEEVIGEDEMVIGYGDITGKLESSIERAIGRNRLRYNQRQSLKTLLKVKKENENTR